MTTFIRVLTATNKAEEVRSAISALNNGRTDHRVFSANSDSFRMIPGSPFAYWVSEDVRDLFQRLSAFEADDRIARAGLQSSDDFRFLRANWEVLAGNRRWVPFAKGGTHSPYYADVYMVINWGADGDEIKSWAGSLYNGSHWSRIIKNTDLYFRPGLFQTLRAARLSPHLTPGGCIFSDNGTQAFCNEENTLALLALLNSSAADALHKLLLGRSGYALYRNGTLARLPIPVYLERQQELSKLACEAWMLMRILDSAEEASHAFVLPAALQARLGMFDPVAVEGDLARIQTQIDDISFDLYNFSDADRASLQASSCTMAAIESADDLDVERESSEEDDAEPRNLGAGLLAWAMGVAFGRFDWRLATGERQAAPEPGPFDPLPAKSPGMLPDGSEPFDLHAGILVDDQGHSQDLTRLAEEVLARVEVAVPGDVRRWLQRDFFAFHLQRYSKSRRKAPIYWPLSTSSGSYSLWVYYPRISSQTLYTAINDFVEPKLKQTGVRIADLRNKGGARSRDDEKHFETLQAFEVELTDLRDTLLKLAPTYKPHHDDGVQISAAPLWPLFRHKPWQKVLKDTWAKLEKGDYDWAHLAMNYWPERVREKCKTDKSLAITHGLEDLYVEPEAKSKKVRGGKAKGFR